MNCKRAWNGGGKCEKTPFSEVRQRPKMAEIEQAHATSRRMPEFSGPWGIADGEGAASVIREGRAAWPWSSRAASFFSR